MGLRGVSAGARIAQIANGLMENEELAALRASYLAAERLPHDRRAYQARFSEVFGDGADLVPYVLAASCSDPRDRTVRDDLSTFKVVATAQPVAVIPRRPRRARQPAASGSRPLVLALISLALFWLVVRVAIEILLLGLR